MAEVPARFPNEEAFRSALDNLGVEVAAYRREGGPREHLVPDFLVGAHAALQAGALAAADRGYLRRYFDGLKLLAV
ncbi:MAG: hypothetical protein ACREIA_22075 [Opitutaceae bacterium]